MKVGFVLLRTVGRCRDRGSQRYPFPPLRTQLAPHPHSLHVALTFCDADCTLPPWAQNGLFTWCRQGSALPVGRTPAISRNGSTGLSEKNTETPQSFPSPNLGLPGVVEKHLGEDGERAGHMLACSHVTKQRRARAKLYPARAHFMEALDNCRGVGYGREATHQPPSMSSQGAPVMMAVKLMALNDHTLIVTSQKKQSLSRN